MAKPALVTALVLSGGGARAAYQAGALRGIAAILGKRRKSPFPVISGTSAGAINAATLAIHADEFRHDERGAESHREHREEASALVQVHPCSLKERRLLSLLA